MRRLKLKMRILEIGTPQWRIAADIDIPPSRFSDIVRGVYEPDNLTKELIAERLRRPVEELFPSTTDPVAAK